MTNTAAHVARRPPQPPEGHERRRPQGAHPFASAAPVIHRRHPSHLPCALAAVTFVTPANGNARTRHDGCGAALVFIRAARASSAPRVEAVEAARYDALTRSWSADAAAASLDLARALLGWVNALSTAEFTTHRAAVDAALYAAAVCVEASTV